MDHSGFLRPQVLQTVATEGAVDTARAEVQALSNMPGAPTFPLAKSQDVTDGAGREPAGARVRPPRKFGQAIQSPELVAGEPLVDRRAAHIQQSRHLTHRQAVFEQANASQLEVETNTRFHR
jgi:hypothetical protein